MAQEKVKVVVTISGGCCTGVYGGKFIDVAVVDFDNDPGDQVWLPQLDQMKDLDSEVRGALESEVPSFLST